MFLFSFGPAFAAVVSLSSSADGTFHADAPTFTWSPSCTAPSCTYVVQLSADPTFTSDVTASSATTSTTWTVPEADWAAGAEGDWRHGVYARVSWTHVSGATGTSNTRKFFATVASFEGAADGDRFGRDVLPTDFDADGVTDLWIASPRVDDTTDDGSPGGEATAGAAYFYAGPFEGAYTTADATASIQGDRRYRAGSSMAAGDFDGDGQLDLALGAARWPGDGSDLGAVYVFFGPITGDLELEDADVVLEGEAPEGRLGYALAAPDLDADGLADLVVGEPGLGAAGAVHLWYGSASWPAAETVAAADVTWTGAGNDALGYAIAAVADPRVTGHDGVVLGAPYADLGAVDGGAVYAMYQTTRYLADEPVLDAAEGWGWGDQAGDRLGGAVAGQVWIGPVRVPPYAGGFLVGAPGDGLDRQGRVLGRSGLPGGGVPEATLAGTANRTGSDAGERCGWQVAGAGEQDGDGLFDYLVGCLTTNGRGRVYVTARLASLNSPLSAAPIAVLEGSHAGEQLGRALGALPDTDGDGDDEIVLGVPGGLTVGGVAAGTVHVLDGGP